MGIRQYVREKIDAERTAYGRKRDSSYVRDKTNESIYETAGLIIELKHGQITPERFLKKIGRIRENYESAVVPEVPYRGVSKARADNYDKFLGKLIEKASKLKDGLKDKDTKMRRVAFMPFEDDYTGFKESDKLYSKVEAKEVRQITRQREYEEEMGKTHPKGVKGLVAGLEKEAGKLEKKAGKIWHQAVSALESVVSILFYSVSAILGVYLIINSKLTGFVISKSTSSLVGKIIIPVFLISLILFMLTKRTGRERGTITLPHLNDRYIRTKYDKERDVWVVKYKSPRGPAMMAIQDTHIPLPTDDSNKIVYEDVRTGRERGKKAKPYNPRS